MCVDVLTVEKARSTFSHCNDLCRYECAAVDNSAQFCYSVGQFKCESIAPFATQRDQILSDTDSLPGKVSVFIGYWQRILGPYEAGLPFNAVVAAFLSSPISVACWAAWNLHCSLLQGSKCV
jgi:hypothetical protein